MIKSSNRKKGVLVGVIAALLLVVTIGVTFAIWNYSRTTDNQILVAGDIYMKYTGTNQINATNVLPIDINNYYSDRYIINPNMTEEELSSCESFFSEVYWNGFFQNEETANAYCKGTGIAQSKTFQQALDTESWFDDDLEELKSLNIIKQEYIPKPVKYKYVRNENMTSEELSSCESFFSQEEFDEVSDARSFCEGTGQGMTFQEMLDNVISSDVPSAIIEQQLSELIENNVIKKEISKEYPAIPYFEFKIEGVNNYSKDIWYEIVLKDGDPPTDEPKRTERLRDDLLRFRLVEVVGEEEQEIFTNRGYEDISDERIYVNTIGANTTEKITRTYRLYMWISDSIKVGVGEGIDYDMETWNDKVYASVKINVAGDFNEKEVNYTQPASCFMTQEFNNQDKTEIMITDYDKSCGRDVVIPSKINGHEVTVIGDSSGYNEGYIMPIGAVLNASFAYKNLTSIVIPNTVRTIGASAFADNNLTKVEIPDSVTWIDEGAFADNNLTKVEIPDSVTWIDEGAFDDNPLEEVKVGSGIEYIGVSAFEAKLNPDNYSNFQRLEVKKTCNEIKNIPDKYEDTQYPWTQTTHKEGLKVYGYEEGQIKLCDTQTIRGVDPV